MKGGEPAAVAAILARERIALARAITTVENEAAGASELLAALRPHLGRAHVVGITGAPGAGKSTLIGSLLGAWLARGSKVAVVAVDPSSPLTGGAVLGDRIRMGEHAGHDDCFIRSLSARGHLGGLSRTSAAVVDVLDAAGFDPVVVETVGTGQSEVAVARLADTRIVLCPPGLGDEVQALKAGVLEIADLLVVSKGDLPDAERTQAELRDMLALRARAPGWQPRVLRLSALAGEGVAPLVAAIDEHRAAAGVGRRLSPSGDPSGDGASLCERLARRDRYVAALGVEFVRARAGSAEVALAIGDEHLNFMGNCHGGVLFALADTAFGLASNGYGSVAAGIDAHITYHAAVRKGDRLLARAHEVTRNRKLAVYRVDVERAPGESIACFTGTVFLTDRRHRP